MYGNCGSASSFFAFLSFFFVRGPLIVARAQNEQDHKYPFLFVFGLYYCIEYFICFLFYASDALSFLCVSDQTIAVGTEKNDPISCT